MINLDEESVSFPSALQLIDLRGTEAIKGDLMPWLRLIIRNKFLFRTTSLSEIDTLTLYQALIELKAELFQEATPPLKSLVNKHVKLFCFVTLLKAGPGEFSQLCETFQHLFPTETNPVRILKSLEDAGMTSPKHLKALSNLMPAKATGDGIRYIISYLRSGAMTSPKHLDLLSQLMPKGIDIDNMKWVLMCLSNGGLGSLGHLSLLNQMIPEEERAPHIYPIVLSLKGATLAQLTDLIGQLPIGAPVEEIVGFICNASCAKEDDA